MLLNLNWSTSGLVNIIDVSLYRLSWVCNNNTMHDLSMRDFSMSDLSMCGLSNPVPVIVLLGAPLHLNMKNVKQRRYRIKTEAWLLLSSDLSSDEPVWARWSGKIFRRLALQSRGRCSLQPMLTLKYSNGVISIMKDIITRSSHTEVPLQGQVVVMGSCFNEVVVQVTK